jgi:RNA 3'-terminal phosphate cyclase-like protein
MEFKGSASFRHRIICATLSGLAISIKRIRSKDEYPGLRDFEIKYLELISKLTNGTSVDINQTGTVLRFTPGVIVNNGGLETIIHECGTERCLSYFLEGILPLVIFGKNKLSLMLRGVSNNILDTSVDAVMQVQIPLLKKAGVEDIDVKVVKRGDEGELHIRCTPIRSIEKGLTMNDPGKVTRVRGIAFSSRLNVQTANRVAYAAKGSLQNFLPDIWIHTDHHKSETALLGVSLVAETNTGCYIQAEYMKGEESTVQNLESDVAEDLGVLASVHLLDELVYGGAVDTLNQSLPIFLMALAVGESTLRLGRLSQQAILLLRLIHQFFAVKFEISELANPAVQEDESPEDEEAYDYEEEDLEDPLRENMPSTILLSCTGIGYQNMARAAF